MALSIFLPDGDNVALDSFSPNYSRNKEGSSSLGFGSSLAASYAEVPRFASDAAEAIVPLKKEKKGEENEGNP